MSIIKQWRRLTQIDPLTDLRNDVRSAKLFVSDISFLDFQDAGGATWALTFSSGDYYLSSTDVAGTVEIVWIKANVTFPVPKLDEELVITGMKVSYQNSNVLTAAMVWTFGMYDASADPAATAIGTLTVGTATGFTSVWSDFNFPLIINTRNLADGRLHHFFVRGASCEQANANDHKLRGINIFSQLRKVA